MGPLWLVGEVASDVLDMADARASLENQPEKRFAAMLAMALMASVTW